MNGIDLFLTIVIFTLILAIDAFAFYWLGKKAWAYVKTLPQRVKTEKFWENVIVSIALIAIMLCIFAVASVVMMTTLCIISVGFICW